MPANRSRTLEWRRCLQQICDRGGAIEIAIRRPQSGGQRPVGDSGLDFIWRVRVIQIDETQILVEQPIALGQPIVLQPNVELIGVLTVGQNRWLFNTRYLGFLPDAENRAVPVIRLKMPTTVQRCQRRSHLRFGTIGLELPTIRVWPLLDPKSVILAERTNEVRVHAEQNGSLPENSSQSVDSLSLSLDDVMPEVGPMFRATMMNIGGGGIGLLVEPCDAQSLTRRKLFWMQIDLPPQLRTPICVTGKLVHTHIESSQQVYAGMAFDFSVNASHQKFVTDQICRYIATQQREQFTQEQHVANEHSDNRDAA